jgi:hypothetical protein
VSEFSQSYHLVSDSKDDAVALLKRAGMRGWVFEPGNGWVTLLISPDEFGEPNKALVAANTGTLLYYLNAEDHGWTFSLYQGAGVVSAYGCSWEGAVEVEDDALDIGVLEAIIAENLPDKAAEARVALERLLHPESREHLLAYYTHTEGMNPGHGFAEVMGLEHFHWLSTHYMELDEGAWPAPVTPVP